MPSLNSEQDGRFIGVNYAWPSSWALWVLRRIPSVCIVFRSSLIEHITRLKRGLIVQYAPRVYVSSSIRPSSPASQRINHVRFGTLGRQTILFSFASTMDQLLLPYLEANDESDRQRYLSELLTQYAVPEVRLALRRRLSFFVDSHGKSPHNQDAEDLFQEIMTRIVQALHDLRKPSATTVIDDLEEYIARITTNCCNDVLRTKSPSRTRLMYNLRFVLSHHADFSIWKSDRRTMTGLAEWRHEEMSPAYVTLSADSEDRLASFRSARFAGEYIKQVPLSRIVAEVFSWLSSPVELDELVSIVAALQDVKDLPAEALHDSHLSDVGSGLSDATLSSHARLEGREILRRLWAALRELSVEQRDVFCLGFEDDRGRDLFTMLLEAEIVTFREITQELDRSTEKIVKLWSQMPMDNKAIAAELKTTRRQVYKSRFRALERLRKGLLPFSGEK